MHKVFVISGVHNNLDHLKKLLPCLKKQTYKNTEIIIVDDGSNDGASDYIRKNYPTIHLLKGDGALWWTGVLHWGVSEALKSSQEGDFIFTVNNDCVFDRDLISDLVKVSISNKRAIVGSLIVDIKDKNYIWDGGVKIDWSKGKFIQLGPPIIADLPKDRQVRDDIDVISTKGTIYPIEIFSKVGNFDKKHLPHYISDYEFSCRVKKSGAKLLLSLKSVVYNDTANTGFGGNLKRSINRSDFNKLLFSRRSKINIIDHFWFITLCCPLRYKFQSYLRLIIKVVYLVSLTI